MTIPSDKIVAAFATLVTAAEEDPGSDNPFGTSGASPEHIQAIEKLGDARPLLPLAQAAKDAIASGSGFDTVANAILSVVKKLALPL